METKLVTVEADCVTVIAGIVTVDAVCVTVTAGIVMVLVEAV